MAFVASLPTFNQLFDAWTYDVGSGLYAPVIEGGGCQFYVARWKMPVQIWAQYRGQREPEIEQDYGHVYPLLLTPIDLEGAAELDPFIYVHSNHPLVALTFDTLGTKYYYIDQAEVRYANFPNQHLAFLLRPTKLEIDPRETPLPPSGDAGPATITVEGTGDGECEDCEALDGDYDIDSGDLPLLGSAPFEWACAPSGTAVWLLYFFGSAVFLQLRDEDVSGETLAVWTNTTTWTSDPQDFILTSGDNPLCEWPTTILVTPV